MKIIINTIILCVFFVANSLAMTEEEFFAEKYINETIDYAILTGKVDGARGCVNESLEFLYEANNSNDQLQRKVFGITGYTLWARATDIIFEINNAVMIKQYQEGPYDKLRGYLKLLNISEDQHGLIMKKIFIKFRERNSIRSK